MPQTQMLTDPNQSATTLRNLDIREISVVYLKGKKNRLKTLKIILEIKIVAPILSQRTAPTTITSITTITVTELKGSQKLFTHPVRHVGKQRLHRELLLWSQCSH